MKAKQNIQRNNKTINKIQIQIIQTIKIVAKSFSEEMKMNTKKKKNQVPFSQFSLNYENYLKFTLQLCIIMHETL